MENHHAKLIKKTKRETRVKPNGKPEREVVLECRKWLKNHGFSVNIVESKAVFSRSSGEYVSGQTDPGFSDCVGVHESGVGVFIEFKAPGKLSTIRPAQHHFLTDKIKFNAFACVVDSVERLQEIFSTYRRIDFNDYQAKQKFLLSMIPNVRSGLREKDFDLTDD